MVALSGTMVRRDRPKLQALLDRWVSTVSDPYWTARDAPWWYNEAASVSSIAAAAWLNAGRALLDYRAPKVRGDVRWKGRADLWMDLGDEEYIGEAKMFWPSLLRRRGHGMTTTMLERACRDAKHNLTSDGVSRVGVLVVAPWTRPLPDTDFRSQTDKFIQGSLTALARATAVAWSFVRLGRRFLFRRDAGIQVSCWASARCRGLACREGRRPALPSLGIPEA